MKPNLKLLCTLLFVLTVVLPVFAVFPDSKPQEQILDNELSSETRVVNADSYEPDNIAFEATYLQADVVPQLLEHTIHVAGDLDWVAFHMWSVGEKFHIYTVRDASHVSVQVQVYKRNNNDGTLTPADIDTGLICGDKIDFTITIDYFTTYFIKVLSAVAGEVGSYDLYYQRVDSDSYEPDNTASQFTTITPTRDIQIENHTLSTYTDFDWHRFYGLAGVTYLFYSTGTIDTDMGVYSDDGTIVWIDLNSGEGYNYRLVYTPTVDAYYKLWVRSANGLETGATTPIGYYDFCYSINPNPDVYEPNNSVSQFTELTISTLNNSQDHTLHDATDQDWYRFYGYSERFYQFYSDSSIDTQIYLYDNNGNMIEWDDNDGDGNNFYIRRALPGDGFYKLKVVGNAGATGFYWLYYSEVPPLDLDEPDDMPSPWFTVISPSPQLAHLDHTLHSNTDQDWIEFAGWPNRIYRFYSTSTIDTQVYLYDVDGNLLDWDDNGGDGNNFDIQFSPIEYDYYRLKVVGTSGVTGYYTFNFIYSLPTDIYEPDNSATQYTTISVSSTLQTQDHTLHCPSETDWYRFYGTAGLSYNFYSTGTLMSSTNCDTRIYLYEDDGNTQLAWDNDSGENWNYDLHFTPSTNNYYKLKVNGGPVWVYSYAFNYLYNADLPIPANVNISIAGDVLTIQWDEVSGAVSYQIEASSEPDTDFAVIGTTSSNYWTGTAALNRRFYLIRAMDTPVP